jgi:hypothetical protein
MPRSKPVRAKSAAPTWRMSLPCDFRDAIEFEIIGPPAGDYEIEVPVMED